MANVNLDHLLLGVNDLRKGMEEFTQLTGVKPVFGGVHPNIGTQNALVSLGPGCYLEIIAPQNPSLPIIGPFGGFKELESLSIFGWAINTNELGSVHNTLASLGIRHSGSQPGSRQTSTGHTLRWTTTFISWERNTFSIHPFFIQWEPSSQHPSYSTPEGCKLMEYQVCKQGDDQASELLDFLQMDAVFESPTGISSGELLGFSIQTPNGLVEFSSGER